MTSVLVDTSFLITLADPVRANHAVAVAYFREALRLGVPLYLSAIVASEFQVGQPVTDLPLRNFAVLPFNIDHAMMTGQLMRGLARTRDAGDDRIAVKDDVKLIAQAICESITHILTEDEKTLVKYLKRFADDGQCSVQSILLVKGFDAAWFTDGQRALPGT